EQTPDSFIGSKTALQLIITSCRQGRTASFECQCSAFSVPRPRHCFLFFAVSVCQPVCAWLSVSSHDRHTDRNERERCLLFVQLYLSFIYLTICMKLFRRFLYSTCGLKAILRLANNGFRGRFGAFHWGSDKRAVGNNTNIH